MPARAKIKAGDKFGYLTVIKEVEPNITPCGTVQRKFLCKCECGNEVVRLRQTLVNSPIASCGCKAFHIGDLNKKYTKEQTSSFLYSTWQGMKQRCIDANSTSYHNYGGRGIKVCDDWLYDYTKFYDWALANGASKGLTLDRIDIDGNYEPSNCRWVDLITQANNTRQNRFIEYNGKRLTVIQWSRKTGIAEATIRARLDKYGYTVAEALGFEPHKTKVYDRSHTRKPVNQYSMDNTLIKEWSSAHEAAATIGISPRSIQHCIYGRYHSSGGFIWRYPDNVKLNKKKRKRVLQYSLDNKLVAEYNDVNEASRATGLYHEFIRDLCNGRRKPSKKVNFIFKYKDYESSNN